MNRCCFFWTIGSNPFSSFLLYYLFLCKHFFVEYNFLEHQVKNKHCPWHTMTPTQIGLGYKWGCLSPCPWCLFLRALWHSVKSEVWIPQDPKGQRCITMTSANKHLGGEHTGTHTHKQANMSWSARFMSQCVSAVKVYVIGKIMMRYQRGMVSWNNRATEMQMAVYVPLMSAINALIQL